MSDIDSETQGRDASRPAMEYDDSIAGPDKVKCHACGGANDEGYAVCEWCEVERHPKQHVETSREDVANALQILTLAGIERGGRLTMHEYASIESRLRSALDKIDAGAQ